MYPVGPSFSGALREALLCGSSQNMEPAVQGEQRGKQEPGIPHLISWAPVSSDAISLTFSSLHIYKLNILKKEYGGPIKSISVSGSTSPSDTSRGFSAFLDITFFRQ